MTATAIPAPTTEITREFESWAGGFVIKVYVVWEGAGVDRPRTTSVVVGLDSPAKRRLAGPYSAAVRAGVVFANPHIRTDIHGSTYVEARSMVSGRRFNADLKRLGF